MRLISPSSPRYNLQEQRKDTRIFVAFVLIWMGLYTLILADSHSCLCTGACHTLHFEMSASPAVKSKTVCMNRNHEMRVRITHLKLLINEEICLQTKKENRLFVTDMLSFYAFFFFERAVKYGLRPGMDWVYKSWPILSPTSRDGPIIFLFYLNPKSFWIFLKFRFFRNYSPIFWNCIIYFRIISFWIF